MIELKNIMRAQTLMENGTKTPWTYKIKEAGKPWNSLYIARLSANLSDRDEPLKLPWTSLKQIGTWVRGHECEAWLSVTNKRIDILIYKSSPQITEIDGIQL